MPDNVSSPVANGTSFASDDIGGVQFPRVKVSWGIDGSAVDTSVTNPFPTSPVFTSGGNLSVAVVGGTGYTAFAAQPLKQLTIVNNTGVTVEFRQDGTGIAIPIFDRDSFSVFGISNASQISLRRNDQQSGNVTIVARWEA